MNLNDFLEKYQKVPVKVFHDPKIDNPLVTVCIQTYQHVDHIRNCLNSILAQKTNFDFEVVIGEDESKDGTRKICKEFVEKYPDRIKLLLHSRQNNIKILGSSSGRFNFTYNLLNARGKYIAFCEGDDYWIDENKLQKQFDALEENKDCSICFTAAEFHYLSMETEEIIRKKIYRPKNASDIRKYSLKEAIRPAGGFMPSASMFFHSKYIENMPSWFFEAIVGDTPLTLYLGTKGDFLYLNIISCVYQIGIKGSWTHSSDDKKRKNRVNGYIWILDQFDDYSNYKYHKKITIQKLKLKLGLLKSRIKKAIRPLRKISMIDRFARYTGN